MWTDIWIVQGYNRISDSCHSAFEERRLNFHPYTYTSARQCKYGAKFLENVVIIIKIKTKTILKNTLLQHHFKIVNLM